MQWFLEIAWWIPLVPLLGAIANGLAGKRLGKTFVSTVGVGTVAAAFGLALGALAALLAVPGRQFQRDLFAWIPLGSPGAGGFGATFEAPVGYLVDPLAAVMILVVTGVGLLIHVYSVGYMGHDEGYSRYFAYLNLFTASMLLLVLANNFLLMFVGWEGVGLCSYLLIGFWYQKESAAAAGKKAFIVNRVGDFGFVIGMLLLFLAFGTLRFTEVNGLARPLVEQGMVTAGMITAITLLLFVGATGKSAQLPLWVWLPDAMEGPTPVSALIHAATMVTAGVYMIARTGALWALAPLSGAVVAITGALTALFAATIALTQYDLKRVLAYSTISQLGLMLLAAGVGAYTAAIFHLMTHAFFKGLLFLAAGSIMHALGNRIDLREMGQLRRRLPQTFLTFGVGWLAIAGVPPLAGFWSKDEILAEALALGTPYWWASGPVLWGIGTLASFLTAFYMSRAFYLAFFSDQRLDRHVEAHVHESPRSMTRPLWILAGLSILGGAPFGWQALGGGQTTLGAFLDPVWAVAAHGAPEAAHHAPVPNWVLMLFATGVAVVGILIARAGYRTRPFETPEPAQRTLGPFWAFFEDKWHIEAIYHAVFVRGGTALARFLAGPVDQGGVDRAVNGVAGAVGKVGTGLSRAQTGLVRSYAMSILAGAILVVAYFAFR
ncbi:MAG: NADH-quinone oxidoreductase subunit L [Armatimonadetes bacterium]|nr:NADH-quinone oxidoreductase subunit L [Armatimonadota bacterium]